MLLSDKLPAMDQFCALLDGSWQEHQWISLQLASPEVRKSDRPADSDDKSLTDIVKPTLDKAAQHAQIVNQMNSNQASPESTEEIENITDDSAVHNFDLGSIEDSITEVQQPEIKPLNSLADLHVDDDLDDITISPMISAPYRRPHSFKAIPESFGFTDPGNSRKENEDAYFIGNLSNEEQVFSINLEGNYKDLLQNKNIEFKLDKLTLSPWNYYLVSKNNNE